MGGTVASALPKDLQSTVNEGTSSVTLMCGLAPDETSELRVAVVGAADAGKTTLCLRLIGRGDERPTRTGVEPCLMPDMMSAERMNQWAYNALPGLTLNLMDCGGRQQYRALWTKFWTGVAGIVFVVDGADASQLPDARAIMQEYVLRHVNSAQIPLLVLVNDRDPPEAMPTPFILSALGLPTGEEEAEASDAPLEAAYLLALLAAATVAAAASAAISRRRTGQRMKWLSKLTPITLGVEPPPPPPARRLMVLRCSTTRDLARDTEELRGHVQSLIERMTSNNDELSRDPNDMHDAVVNYSTLAPGMQFALGLSRRKARS